MGIHDYIFQMCCKVPWFAVYTVASYMVGWWWLFVYTITQWRTSASILHTEQKPANRTVEGKVLAVH